MESENIRIMRKGYEAFNRGDFDAAVELMHPDIEMQRSDLAPETGSIRGSEAIRAWMQPDIFEDRAFHVWTIRDGKAVRMEFYADRAEAREAAGLD